MSQAGTYIYNKGKSFVVSVGTISGTLKFTELLDLFDVIEVTQFTLFDFNLVIEVNT